MNERLLKTKSELEKEYKLNENEINKIKEKIKVLNSNLIESKIWVFAITYAVSFLVLFFASPIILSIGPNFLVNIIEANPLNILKCLFITPIIPSVIVERITSKVNYKKLNKFSSAKTSEQKREELFEYELEAKKLNDKNSVINRAYNFASNIETKSNLSNLNMSKEEHQQYNKILRDTINDNEKELEISTTQGFIKNRFSMLRSKEGKLVTLGIPIFAGGITAVLAFLGTIVFAPDMFMLSTPAVDSLLKTICLSAGMLGTGISGVATYLRRKQDRRIFNKINNRLGENKLPENCDNHFEELAKINCKKDSIIYKLADTYLAYQDSTRELEIISNELNYDEGALDEIVMDTKNSEEIDYSTLFALSEDKGYTKVKK